MADRKTDRFLTTVLFTDIVGSTDLAAELGDRAWRELVQEHHRIVRAALKRHSGREVDTAGDGFFAIFDAPAAAVDCALEVAKQVQPLGLQIRAGLHVGEVEQSAGKVSGLSVPIGSRIMSQAEPSQVLVSGTVRDLAVGAGFRFEDRGARELKGVPGEWRLYAASRTQDADDLAIAPSQPDQAEKRAAAVRRRQARPIWLRHPRAAAGLVAGLALVVGLVGLWYWQPWLPPALAGVAENSVGVIDPARNVVIATAAVGALPSAIAAGEGSVWVANSGDDTVSQIDPASRSVIDTIEVGHEPNGITVGGGSVWVVDSGDRSVTRINAATRRVVDTIEVGNRPVAIAYGASGVWVANAGDATVSRIDPDSGQVSEPISLRASPTAIAADESGAWVVSADAGTVTHLDAATASATTAPLAVGQRPAAIVLDDGAIYIANSADDTVSVVDPVAFRVSATIDLAGAPTALTLDGRTLWVADRAGAVERVELGDPTKSHPRIELGSSAEAVIVVDGRPWVVTRASLSAHRGGTMEIVSSFPTDIDPAVYANPTFADLALDGLVGFEHVGGVAGSQLFADLATALPQPSDGGRTYAFKLRDGLMYSDGTLVRASDFRSGLERVFQLPGNEDAAGFAFDQYAALAGMDACSDPPVARCDLSSGIVVDDDRATITFHLTRPDSSFLSHLALSFATPLPPSVSGTEQIDGAYPVTGPYMISNANETSLELRRNPHFAPRDGRPDGYVDAVNWTSGVEPKDGLHMVEAGTADYIVDQLPADEFPLLQTQYAQLLHIAPGSTTFVFFDTQKPPFDQVDVRRAVNMALDRAHVVGLRGGPFAAQPTCQVLPPNFPGFVPYCPYTKDPTPAGRWSAPDLDGAAQLVAQSGTAGSHVVVGPFVPRLTPVAEYVASVLADLGYDVSLETATEGGQVFEAVGEGRVMVGGFEWLPDFPAPDSSLGQFGCGVSNNLTHSCDAELDALMGHARDLQVTDPAAANEVWAQVDRAVTDLALWAPLVNEGSDLVSSRVGNYQFSPALGPLLDLMWVQ
ncbi:MAG: ABC transporter substrate-binding protein [Chloroflexota bacterium]